MSFGAIAKAKLPSLYGEFYMHVLPEQIDLGRQHNRTVATYLEHYAMVPRDFDPAKPATIFLRHRDVVADLFAAGSGKTPSLQRRILSELAGRNGILLCLDRLSPFARRAFMRGKAAVRSADQLQIAKIFKQELGIHRLSVRHTTLYTDTVHPRSMRLETDVGAFYVKRYDMVNRVSFPAQALAHLFPQATDSPPIYVKHLENYFLCREGTDMAKALTRVHSSCETGDKNASSRCDCGDQYYLTAEKIGRETGIIVYLDQEGRAMHSLALKIQQYARMPLQQSGWEEDPFGLEQKGLGTYQAMNDFGYPDDKRNYHAAAEILRQEGIEQIVLFSNNPDKEAGIKETGIKIIDRESVPVQHVHEATEPYLRAKKAHGHRLELN